MHGRFTTTYLNVIYSHLFPDNETNKIRAVTFSEDKHSLNFENIKIILTDRSVFQITLKKLLGKYL